MKNSFSLLLTIALLGTFLVSGAENVLKAKKIAGLSGCRAMAIYERKLYAADDKRLVVFDLAANPKQPKKCGETAVCGARQIVTDGHYLYLSARQNGVYVLDVSRPEAPKLISNIDTVELATGVELAGNLLCVALRVYGVQMFDVTRPDHARHLSLLRTPEAQSVFYFDRKLAIGNWYAGQFTIADIRNPRQPKILGSASMDGFGDGVWVNGRIGYAATGQNARSGSKEKRYGRGHGLEIFDLSRPEAPRRLGGLKFPKFYESGNDSWLVRSDGRTAFVTDTHNGFFLVDVENPASPKQLGRFVLPNVERYSVAAKKKVNMPDCATSFAVGDGVVYVGGQKTGIFAVEVGERAKPMPRKVSGPEIPPKEEISIPGGLVRIPVDAPVRRLAVRNNELFAACSDAGVKRFRIGKDGTLTERPGLRGKRAYDVAVSGDILLAACGGTLETYRIEENRLEPLGTFASSFYRPIQIVHAIEPGVAVCSGGTSWVQSVDFSNPEHPRLAGVDSAIALLYSDVIPERAIDGVFPVSWHSRGIRFYRCQDGKMNLLAQPRPKTNLGQQAGIIAMGNRFLVPVRTGFLKLDPNTGDIEECKVPGVKRLTGIPSWDGERIVAVSDRRNGQVRTFDFSVPERPVLIPSRCYDLSNGIPDRVVFHGGRMFIPGWNLGILVEKR